MNVGASLLLILVGGILKFGVTARPSGVNLDTIGVVTMLVGVIGLVLSLITYQRRGSVVTRRKTYADDVDGATVVEERRSYEEPPPQY
ncbi:MAG TPA: DUF6458 family protein [Mycobacteriales bacterium]|nr:DUF6458 family protein [Mycobacteriales bacterium]